MSAAVAAGRKVDWPEEVTSWGLDVEQLEEGDKLPFI